MNEQADPANRDAVYLIVGTVTVLVPVIVICYLRTLHKALSRISPRNRRMTPALVWLTLIPYFGVIWQFFIAMRVPRSLRNEFRDRGRDDGSDYGKSLVFTQAVLGVVSWISCNVPGLADPDLDLVGSRVAVFFMIVGLIVLVIFWIKIARYSRQLAEDVGPPRDWLRKFDNDDDGFGKRGPYPDAPRPPPDAFKEGDPGHYQ